MQFAAGSRVFELRCLGQKFTTKIDERSILRLDLCHDLGISRLDVAEELRIFLRQRSRSFSQGDKDRGDTAAQSDVA